MTSPPPSSHRPNLLLLGATGFTGKIALKYLIDKQYHTKANIVAAARNTEKLKQQLQTLGHLQDRVKVQRCDLKQDLEELEKLVQDAHVVVNFAGSPFFDKAMKVIEFCVKFGTHYCDITGETHLHRVSYDTYHEQAQHSGSIILHQCGFDSVPADITSFLAAQTFRERYDSQLTHINVMVEKAKGGVSGGTLETFVQSFGSHVPGVSAIARDGFHVLVPGGRPRNSSNYDCFRFIGYDRIFRTSYMPSVMAACNVPVVLKTASLLGYGEGITVTEAMATSSIIDSLLKSFSLAMLACFIAIAPLRNFFKWLKIIPSPGEGPSKASMDSGFFVVAASAASSAAPDSKVVARFNSGCQGDPGYKSTAQMCVECAMCLVEGFSDGSVHPVGVLTPAAALGMDYVNRLRMSGMSIEVEE